MELLAIILLGVVQGVTEFLPISSDGHLAVLQALLQYAGCLELPDPLGLTIVLHAGTLFAVLVVYARTIWRVLCHDRRVIGLVAVGTLPAALVGPPLQKFAGGVLADPFLAGCMLPLTGLLLLLPLWFR